MPRFEPKAYNFLVRRIVQRVIARSALTDLEDGDPLHQLSAAVARELADAYLQMTNLRDLWNLDRARGADLDDRAADILPVGQTRLGAAKATATAVFSRPSPPPAVPVNIPAGTLVATSTGTTYRTTAAGTIPASVTTSGSVPIEALVGGSAGNVGVGAITVLSVPPPGVTGVTNDTAAIGGRDLESDTEFRERIYRYIQANTGRETIPGLEEAALTAAIQGTGEVKYAKAVEGGNQPGLATLYVDDGFGSIEATATIPGTETILAAIQGGETRFNVANVPVKEGSPFALQVGAPANVALTEGVDYTLTRPWGQIVLDETLYPAGAPPAWVGSPLEVTVYSYYTGLIALVQKIIDGDPADRDRFPGYRAAGVLVTVLAPQERLQTFVADITVQDGYDQSAVAVEVETAITSYINGLGIGQDVILSELIERAMGVEGMFDVSVSTPSANVVILDNEIARIDSGSITIT